MIYGSFILDVLVCIRISMEKSLCIFLSDGCMFYIYSSFMLDVLVCIRVSMENNLCIFLSDGFMF
jgi:hypothetical protein